MPSTVRKTRGASLNRGKTKAQIEAETRQRETAAVGLRATGMHYDDIAVQLGWANESSARSAVQRSLDRNNEVEVATYRQLQAVRYVEMEKVAWEVIRTTHFAVNFGKVAYITVEEPDPENPGQMRFVNKPVEDDGPKLSAIDKLLKIEAARARLFGTEAPTKRIVEVITEDVIDKALAALDAELDDLLGLGAGTTADAG